MKRKIISRALTGFPIGIAIGNAITIFISLLLRDGNYHPCLPQLVAMTGSEISAVLLQTALCGILGSIFSAGSIIWELEDWSIARQTFAYFLITTCAMLPIAYINHWMQHSIGGFFSYLLFYAAIFFVIWLIQFIRLRKKIAAINDRLKR